MRGNTFRFGYTDYTGVVLGLAIVAGLSLAGGWLGMWVAVAIVSAVVWTRRQASIDAWTMYYYFTSELSGHYCSMHGLQHDMAMTRKRLVRIERWAQVPGVVGEQETFVRNVAYDLIIDAQARGSRDQNVLILWTFPTALTESDQRSVESTAATVGAHGKYLHDLSAHRPWILWTSSCGEFHASPSRITQGGYKRLYASYTVWSPTSTNMDPWQWFIKNLPLHGIGVDVRPATQPTIDE